MKETLASPARDTNEQTDTPTPAPSNEAETLFCVNHPNVETLLRCNRCGKPICLKCAQLTDVGYRCQECIRGVQSKYFNALPTDNIIAFGVALVVTAIAVPVANLVLFRFGILGWLLAFMIGGAAGGLLAQIIRTSVGRRRGRNMPYFALAGIIIGVLIGSLTGAILMSTPLISIPLLILAFLAATTAYQMLR